MAVTFAGSGVMERILQQRTHQLREFCVRGVVLLNYFFAPRIAFFAGLKTLNLITVLAGILIFCCFFGLIPVRAFLLCFTSFPNPGTTNSPWAAPCGLFRAFVHGPDFAGESKSV